MEIVQLSSVNMTDLALVGGKNGSLGEMIQNLTSVGQIKCLGGAEPPVRIAVPPGFAITTVGFASFLDRNQLSVRIAEALRQINYADLLSLQTMGEYIRTIIRNGTFPPELEAGILEHYEQLRIQIGQIEDIACAVRSSSTAEDLQDASFAGQQETYLNIRGGESILTAIKDCFASLYTDRAISYRHSIQYEGILSISVGVQLMVESYCSGVAFSLDPDTGFDQVVVINGAYGLGELVVQGGISPDEFIVFKPTATIIDQKLRIKTEQIIYGEGSGIMKVPVPVPLQTEFCLREAEVLQLANWVVQIERHYGKPVDVEWALNANRDLYIVQARPETIHANRKNANQVVQYQISTTNSPLLTGIAVGDRISSGKVRIMQHINDEFAKGDILVTDITDPDWEPIMMQAGAIITNKGGRTCHSAIIAREMGINAIVGTNNCTELLHDGQVVTVSCAEGEVGYIYAGDIPYTTTCLDLDQLPTLKTKIMFNIASPNDVFKYAAYPTKGVGLVREEFIINNYIQVHPLALINYEKGDSTLKSKIDALTIGYASPTEYYIHKLAYGLARIAATFYPHDVIVRFSDFKSNEYRNLLGGDQYEPIESNPMIGWRGCSRYYSEQFKSAFGLECLAIKKVREEMGLTNVIVMLPFCRTPLECIKVQEVMGEYGLYRGVNGLQVYIMCELPSNIICADEFCKYVDGFSIGSNDLTQLILGLDRDSDLVAHIYDERNPAVKMMISQVIQSCKKNGVKIGICGQAPADFPDFAQFLVEEGIDSISITPDAVLKTFLAIAEIEQRLK